MLFRSDTVEEDLQVSLSHLREAPKLRDRLERATLVGKVRDLTRSDPVDRTAEETALDNVRGAADALEARLEVLDAVADPPARTPEDDEARARAELARLKAEREAKK